MSPEEGRYSIDRITQYAPQELIGRDVEKARISDAWARVLGTETGRPRILTLVALGGEGKTSLVAKWAVDEMLAKGWLGCEAAFAWSFYSQGTRDQVAASSDAFLKAALDFFADNDDDRTFAASAAGAYEKGQRLAHLVGRQRSLLILDGLEPLQYGPSAPTPGELKDQGLVALLRGLAQRNCGLCLVTTRYPVPDLTAFRQSTAPEEVLMRLSREAGVSMLKAAGVCGSELRNLRLDEAHEGSELVNEFEKLVEDLKGHALSVALMGSYLVRFHKKDVRARHHVKLIGQGGKDHAAHVMDAYVQSLVPSGWRTWLCCLVDTKLRGLRTQGKRALAVLRLLGLFDRPADATCIQALRCPPIRGLTEDITHLNDAEWNDTLNSLESARLLTVHCEAGSGSLISLDAHPLLREYFARKLCEQRPEAWRAAHGRLFEHLCANTKEGEQPTLDDLQPLYQAVVHGCLAGLQQDAYDKVYKARIAKQAEAYAVKKLGAYGSDLGAVACFFAEPWKRVSPALPKKYQGFLYNQAAFRLRALGRLTEALTPMHAGLESHVEQHNWGEATTCATNVSELELMMGQLDAAEQFAQQSVTHADRNADASKQIISRSVQADALHQAGHRDKAHGLFREAEQIQQQFQSHYPLLYSLQGFRYADLLLAATERAAWNGGTQGQPQSAEATTALRETLQAVRSRAAKTLEWAEHAKKDVLSAAHDHLTLARTALFAALLSEAPLCSADLAQAHREVGKAVAGMYSGGAQHHTPRSLLTRSWLRAITGPLTGPDSAQTDLDEAWDIAKRGPMRLHMADIHIYRARLFFREAQYPRLWESPEADLTSARNLIKDCGYGRRLEELEDAETALAQWRQNHPAPT